MTFRYTPEAMSADDFRAKFGRSFYRVCAQANEQISGVVRADLVQIGMRRWRKGLPDPVVIYRAIAPDDRAYIGQTVNFPSRQAHHLFCALRGGSQTEFHRAIRELGPDNIRWKILAVVEPHMADETEARAIVALGTLRPRGFNSRGNARLTAPAPLFGEAA